MRRGSSLGYIRVSSKGRESFSWIEESFQRHLSDELIKEARELAIDSTIAAEVIVSDLNSTRLY